MGTSTSTEQTTTGQVTQKIEKKKEVTFEDKELRKKMKMMIH